ncbi:putative membrane protein [Caldicoprobacter guelmensis]|uniref:DUF4321 domain-containing protein n=1 Tax=Caldicoprobacter guelmensis TaxID=1170224 RepID=UPI001956763E|nr:DUF4321 domain-containing protein [Caldicoprobacter guelmensis]MBM7583059.1 putative membrane protein [Caldicoprobacter guelmensis]
MRRGSSRRGGVLLLLLLAGIIIGSIIGKILAAYFDIPLFTQSFKIGTEDNPLILDVEVVNLVLGITFTINFGTVLGVLLGLIFYFKSLN